jgi:heptose-I-phosphate ethanolaminephosphotransferase
MFGFTKSNKKIMQLANFFLQIKIFFSKHLIIKAIVFALFPLCYYLLDFLNYSQAGKIGILGFFIFVSIFYIEAKFSKYYTIIHKFTILIVIVFFAFLSFHFAVRDIFNLEQNNNYLMGIIFGTDSSEAYEFFIQYKYYIIKHLTIFTIITIFYLYFISKKPQIIFNKKTNILFGVFIILTILLHLNPAKRFNPFVYFPYYYLEYKQDIKNTKKLVDSIKTIDKSSLAIISDNKPKTIILVIGESDTWHNWSLYGYGRNTNPMLSKHQNIIRFKNVKSAGLATIDSITKMLTPANKANSSLWKSKHNIINIANLSGYETYWISNHNTDKKGILGAISGSAKHKIWTNKGRDRGESSYDEAIIAPYKEALQSTNSKKFIIVHLLGSHPDYNFRYPDKYKKFTSNDLVAKNLKKQGRSDYAIFFRNSYDNSVLYTDYILNEILKPIKNTTNPTNFIYISDHGQDVAHNSNFSGHNHKSIQQSDVPMLFWSNFRKYPKNDSDYNADNLNHSIIDLLNIKYKDYNNDLSIFKNENSK